MKITLNGIKAGIALIIVIAIAILLLIFLLNLIVLLVPFIITLIILIWFLSLFKKKKGFVDVNFKVK